MIPRWMIFNKRLLIDSGILLEKHYVKADSWLEYNVNIGYEHLNSNKITL
jgi:hypothetical protein